MYEAAGGVVDKLMTTTMCCVVMHFSKRRTASTRKTIYGMEYKMKNERGEKIFFRCSSSFSILVSFHFIFFFFFPLLDGYCVYTCESNVLSRGQEEASTSRENEFFTSRSELDIRVNFFFFRWKREQINVVQCV